MRKQHINRVSIVKMMMFRWMSGSKTKNNRVRNEDIKDNLAQYQLKIKWEKNACDGGEDQESCIFYWVVGRGWLVSFRPICGGSEASTAPLGGKIVLDMKAEVLGEGSRNGRV